MSTIITRTPASSQNISFELTGDVTAGPGSGSQVATLATVSDSGTGSFLKLTRNSKGLVTGTEAVVAGDITSLVDSTYVNIAGDIMTGSLTLANLPNALTSGVYALQFKSGETTATNDAWTFDTSVTHTTGSLLKLSNNGTTRFAINGSGTLTLTPANNVSTLNISSTHTTATAGISHTITNNGSVVQTIGYDLTIASGNILQDNIGFRATVDVKAFGSSGAAFSAIATNGFAYLGSSTSNGMSLSISGSSHYAQTLTASNAAYTGTAQVIALTTPIGSAAFISCTNAGVEKYRLTKDGEAFFAGDIIGTDFVRTRSGTISRSGDYVSAVALAGGRTINITRDGNGYISSVTDGTHTWTYTRDGNNKITSWSVT